MENSKVYIAAGAAVIVGIFIYAIWKESQDKPVPVREQPSLRGQAIQVKETLMPEMISLKGKLKRKRKFIAVMEADAEKGKKCKKGLESVIRIKDHSKAYRSKIRRIRRLGKTGGYQVEIPLPQASGGLRIGATAWATIYRDAEVPALAVPWAAIDERDGNWVWVVQFEKTPLRIPVKLGSYDTNVVAISGEVEAEDWVVLAPHDALSEDRELDVSEVQ